MAITAKRGEIEVVDPGKVRIRGYAAVTGNEFTYYDPYQFRKRRMVVEPGAFSSVLSALDGPLPIYWSHMTERYQIGETDQLFEDSTGLYFAGNAFASDDAVDALTTMYGRRSTGASMLSLFGKVVKGQNGLERITSFREIGEVGPTPKGVNPLAWSAICPRPESTESTAAPPAPATTFALALSIQRATAKLRRI